MEWIRLPSYESTYAYEGNEYAVEVKDLELRRCTASSCGAMMLDDATEEILDNAARQRIGILQPLEIIESRKKLGLSRRALADAIGIDEDSIELYETGGQLTPRAIDRLLRKIFENPEVRKAYGLEPGAVGSVIPAPTTAVA